MIFNRDFLRGLIFLMICSAFPLGAMGEDLNGIKQFSEIPMNGVVLRGSSTLVVSGNGGTSAATEGEAFFCEGDPPTNYECSNSYATYGCSEETQTCYYEEKYREEDPEFNLSGR